MNQPQSRTSPPARSKGERPGAPRTGSPFVQSTRRPPAAFDDQDLPIAAVWTIDELDHSADLESVRSARAYTDGFSE